jgi:pilus assembly protein CpaB
MRRGRRSNRLALVLSLVFGVLAAVVAFPLLKSRDTTEAPPPIVTVPVIVAARDIPARTVLTADMLTFSDVPVDAMHAQSITELETAVGQVLQYPAVMGEAILQPKLTEVDEGLGLAGAIPSGKRAMAVEVNDVRGSAGLINPGDKVDVLAAFDQQDTGYDDIGIVVLQDVVVIAVAQELNPPDPNVAQSDDAVSTSSIGETTRTVTLAVSPEEGERLILADTMGTLRLGLRAKDDGSTSPGLGITLSELIGAPTGPGE